MEKTITIVGPITHSVPAHLVRVHHKRIDDPQQQEPVGPRLSSEARETAILAAIERMPSGYFAASEVHKVLDIQITLTAVANYLNKFTDAGQLYRQKTGSRYFYRRK